MTTAPAQTWPALGTPVTYSDDGKFGEWKRGGPYYFAGVTQQPGDKISVWISDKWPVESMGNLTDGFSPEEWGLHKVGALRDGVGEYQRGLEDAAAEMDRNHETNGRIAAQIRDEDMEMAKVHKSMAHTYWHAASAIRALIPPTPLAPVAAQKEGM